MDRAIQSPFVAREPRRFAGALLTLALHVFVAGVLLVGFHSLQEPPLEATLLTVALLPVQQASPPHPAAPREPTLLRPTLPEQTAPRPAIAQQDPAPAATAAMTNTRLPATEPVPAAPSGDVTSALENWEGRVMAELRSKERYPAEAAQAGQQDVVTVRVVLDGAGNVLQASVFTSKHFPLLDDAALELVRSCSPLPPPPAAALADNTIAFDVPIDYTIGGRR